jgi:GNAT superfamily N-acetyltransferase
MCDKVRYEEIDLEDLRHQKLILVLSKLNNFYNLELSYILSLKQKRDKLKGIIAFEGNKAIAYILYEERYSKIKIPIINFQLVDKNYRNKSVGSELLKKTEERFIGKVLGVEVDIRQLSKNYYNKKGYNFKYAKCLLTNKEILQPIIIDKGAPHIQIMYKYCESEQTLNMANKSKEGINELIKQFQKDDAYKDGFIGIITAFLSNEYKTRKSNEEFLKMKRKAMTLIENIHENKITEYDKTLMIYISLKTLKK